jgi:glycosyltransferase involved in cell wall biosynthesis
MAVSIASKIRSRLSRITSTAFEGVPGMLFSMRPVMSESRHIVYISEMRDWAIDQVGQQVQRFLPEPYSMRITGTYKGYRNTTLHLGAPSLYLKPAHLEAMRSRSNRILLSWTHGLPDNPDPTIQSRIESMAAAIPYFDRILAMTGTGRDFLVQMGIPPERIALIPLGVDLNVFKPRSESQRIAARRALGIPDDAVCIGSFQKDSPGWDNSSKEPKLIKGPDLLVDALIRIAAKQPLFVLLTGPARGYVISRLQEADIAYRHDVLDSPNNLSQYYHALDLYLITSRDEGGPMGLLEAMASGVPVVSTRMGIPRDILCHCQNGLLVDIDDLDGVVESAEQILGDKMLAAQIAQEALRTVQAHDWSIIARRYAHELYDPVVQ